jgi:hypothetical protein
MHALFQGCPPEEMMDPLQRNSIELACAKLCNAYALRLDAYDYDRFIELWSKDAVLDLFGREFSGLPAIRTFLEGREAEMICRHIVTNIEVDVLDAETAKGTCYTASYRVQNGLGSEPGPLTPPTFLMDCHSLFKLDPKRGWVFTRRNVRAAMAGEQQILALLGQPWSPRPRTSSTG